jgi:hypothetical protein
MTFKRDVDKLRHLARDQVFSNSECSIKESLARTYPQFSDEVLLYDAHLAEI